VTYIRLTDTYRPKQFRQIMGQPDIAVVKAIFEDLDELPPLLLFCGLSGVGKTSVARVIAARVNCEQPNAQGEPCANCSSCLAIYANNHPNVEELDAATNGSADKLRELVLRSHLQSNGVKTFIIDEAQSISAQGWNVLLKVLEEPPPNCLFILLTSEPRKVPTKIRTRALRFNLKQVSPTILSPWIALVVDHAELDITEDDINVIVDLCEGSVRDCLMMLEQVAVSSFTAEELFSSRDLSLDFFTQLMLKDYEGLLITVDTWWAEVSDAKTILSQMATTLEKIAHSRTGLEFYGGATKKSSYSELSSGLTMNKVAVCLEVISEWFNQSYSKAQLLLLTARLYKLTNGSAINIVPQEVKADPIVGTQNGQALVSAADIRDQLKGF